MANRTTRYISRLKRKKRIRKNMVGTPERPRLSVFRSSTHIYAQIIDDIDGNTLVSASTLDPEFTATGNRCGNRDAAVAIGKMIAGRALGKGITKVVFDRNGFLYHGRVKALSDGAREAGLQF
ncbi:50S ribosomal subunit protein L18 [Desulfamplus magnetovallimortis]|uniref:Large ribosomal subunit protein uL18 n=1 Tax=Desulfamplus magnetovallimortis TaxID=1246637 RepID=A0A1W1H5V7_9BACT|nr:50S ribosomal protein L18 [Desulfamplus magnetovallimortis]SLM27765.1 50S ribosomal subunit protein L18 [Desulfamplus magnetovallimortis]